MLCWALFLEGEIFEKRIFLVFWLRKQMETRTLAEYVRVLPIIYAIAGPNLCYFELKCREISFLSLLVLCKKGWTAFTLARLL